MVIFLKNNVSQFNAADKEVVDFTVKISNQTNGINIAEISTGIENHS